MMSPQRLTIIRTKARGNIPGWKEIVTGDKVTINRRVECSEEQWRQ